MALPRVLGLVQVATARAAADVEAPEAARRGQGGIGRSGKDVRPRAAGAHVEAAGKDALTARSTPTRTARAAALLSCLALLCVAVLAGCGSDGSERSTGEGNPNDAAASGDSKAPASDSGGRRDAATDATGEGEAGRGDGAGMGADGGTDGDAAGGLGDAAIAADGGAETDGPFVPAMHPAFPQLRSANGSVLAHPSVVGLFFSDYDNTPGVTAMLQGLPDVSPPDGGTFWSAAVSEYGVGALTMLPPVMLGQAAPTAGSASPAAFVGNQVDTNPALANVDTSTIVAVFYPSTTPLSGSCAAQTIGWGGYHDSVMTTKGRIPFAVIAECANFASLTSTLDMVTVAASHEIMEAATDPFLSAWSSLDRSTPSGWAWDVLLGGNEEDGDMCSVNASFRRASSDYPYLLQLGWSNRAAAAGNVDPCQPDVLAAQPFVGAYPVMPDTVNVPAGGGSSSGPGALIANGSSKTVEVDCYSFQPTAPFTVGARQARTIQPPQLAFAWDRTTCVNGEKLHLTITVQSQPARGVEPFVVYGQLPGAADPQAPVWAGVVAQQ
jgi:hypothetical protein